MKGRAASIVLLIEIDPQTFKEMKGHCLVSLRCNVHHVEPEEVLSMNIRAQLKQCSTRVHIASV